MRTDAHDSVGFTLSSVFSLKKLDTSDAELCFTKQCPTLLLVYSGCCGEDYSSLSGTENMFNPAKCLRVREHACA